MRGWNPGGEFALAQALFGEGLPLRVADRGVNYLGELPTGVPVAYRHLAFSLVNELAGSAFPQPYGQWGEHFQDAADRFAGLVEADPDEIPAGQRRGAGRCP